MRDELSYDRMYPHADRMYRLSMDINGATRTSLGNADVRFGPAMKLDFPGSGSRDAAHAGMGYMKHKDVSVWQDFRRAAPNFFQMFPPQVAGGGPNAALSRPNMLVVTRRFAHQLFGREDVVGESVELQFDNPRTLQIGAVIENLPSNTHFRFDVSNPRRVKRPVELNNAFTYVRLRPGTTCSNCGPPAGLRQSGMFPRS